MALDGPTARMDFLRELTDVLMQVQNAEDQLSLGITPDLSEACTRLNRCVQSLNDQVQADGRGADAGY